MRARKAIARTILIANMLRASGAASAEETRAGLRAVLQHFARRGYKAADLRPIADYIRTLSWLVAFAPSLGDGLDALQLQF